MNDPSATRTLSIRICSLDYDASATGIPKYAGEAGAWLARRGHRVEVVASHPHYQSWRVSPKYAGVGAHTEILEGVRVHRIPVRLPSRGPLRSRHRIGMEIGFLLRSLRVWLGWIRASAPDCVLVVCPSFLAALPALLFARRRGLPLVLHVQDLQADAAIGLGMLGAAGRVARWNERFVVGRATLVLTIADAMRDRIAAIRGDDAVVTLPNWADVDGIRPGPTDNSFRREIGVSPENFLVVCAGSMAEKHGLEVVLEAAAILREDPAFRFALVGDGSARARLLERAAALRLENVTFWDVQPPERLGEILAAGDLHLVVQRRGAAGAVMPSKVGNVLAAGRPLLVTAEPGTELYDRIVGSDIGVACVPEDPEALVVSINRLREDSTLRNGLGRRARAFAETHLAKEPLLREFEMRLLGLVDGMRKSRDP